jgi:probable aminopeptidase NPEPL1
VADITLARTISQALKGKQHVLLLAPKQRLAAGVWRKVLGGDAPAALEHMVEETDPGALGAVATTWGDGAGPRRITIGALPDAVSRHAAPARNHAVQETLARADLRGGEVGIVVALDDPSHYLPVALAVGRAFPLYRRKSGTAAAAKARTRVTIVACDAEGEAIAPPDGLSEAVEAARWVAALVDRPTSEKSTADFVTEARKFVKPTGAVRERTIVGPALKRAGLEGIYNVGRGAEVAPRLLHLERAAPRAKKGKKGKKPLVVALVGKGIVFDTGGLHVKARGNMEGMKSDMGGAAAVVAAFRLLVREGTPFHLHCLAPLAENAVGPTAYRPDEILTLHSGKTVEINNTDAEGRLLLADAVSYAARELDADVIIDAATLTGAQLVSTGKRHAAVVSNREGLEALAVRAGRASGDLVHPLLFAPEFYQSEFKSELADMTNSVKDRNNAQSSCAAQFVYSHIQDLDTPWLHIDLAGPAHVDNKGTGFGVALICEVVRGLERKLLEA